MDHSQNPKSQSSKIITKRLTQDQIRLLEVSFAATKKLEPEIKFQLARELGVPPRQIAIWYQNKRARWRNQSLESGYVSIQVRLEAALAENDRLGKEVDSLRGELKRAQDMLFGFEQTQAQAQAHQLACAARHPLQVSSALSSCCDDGAASSCLNDDVGCSADWDNGEALHYDELYACLGINREGVNERYFWV
ncbi:hypothetical protein OROMI_019881 [Orobanche minor]